MRKRSTKELLSYVRNQINERYDRFKLISPPEIFGKLENVLKKRNDYSVTNGIYRWYCYVFERGNYVNLESKKLLIIFFDIHIDVQMTWLVSEL